MANEYTRALERRNALLEIIAEAANEIAEIDRNLPILQSNRLEADLLQAEEQFAAWSPIIQTSGMNFWGEFMTDRWNLNNLGQFFRDQQFMPTEYDRLITKDPAGRLWNALVTSEQAFVDARHELQALGPSDLSILPARSIELENIMNTAASTRTAMIRGLQLVCDTLNTTAYNESPTRRYFDERQAYLRRQPPKRRDTGEISTLEAVFARLEAVANSCFQWVSKRIPQHRDRITRPRVRNAAILPGYYNGRAEGHEYPDLQVGDEVNPCGFFALT
jgi:hypothetical protein